MPVVPDPLGVMQVPPPEGVTAIVTLAGDEDVATCCPNPLNAKALWLALMDTVELLVAMDFWSSWGAVVSDMALAHEPAGEFVAPMFTTQFVPEADRAQSLPKVLVS